MDGGAEHGGSRKRRSRRPRRMVEELLEEDGICVMASGMGLTAVAGALLRLQVHRRRTPGQRGAAFVIGAAEWQRDLLLEELADLDEHEAEEEEEEEEETEPEGEEDAGGEGATTTTITTDAFAALRDASIRRGRRRARSLHGPAAAVVTAETPAVSRASLYATAGVIFISTRILVVDFLTGRVGGAGGTTVNSSSSSSSSSSSASPSPRPPPPAELAGLLVMNAHRSTPNSADAFAAALARAAAPAAWLRALSDAPPAFLGEFARAERVLGALRLRKLRLWPRFEATVKEALRVSSEGGSGEGRETAAAADGGGGSDGDKNGADPEKSTPPPPSLPGSPVQVVELAVKPTPEMASAYEAIADLMDACLRELRRCPALASAANSALLTLEGAGVLPSCDAAVASALEAAGMRSGGSGAAGGAAGARARGTAADLRTLRALADALLRLDAVSFLRRLETLRAVDTSSGSLSGGIGGGGGWLLHDAAHALFSAAKRRVFVLVRGRGSEEEGLAVAAAAAAAEAARGGKRQRGGGGGSGGRAATASSSSAAAAAPSNSNNAAASVVPVLEPLPKWSLVLDILAEIQSERERLLSSSGGGSIDNKNAAAGDDSSSNFARVAAAEAPVLVVSRDARTAAQLRACVAAGGTEPVMRALYEEYLASRLTAAAASASARGSGDVQGRGRGGRGRGLGRGNHQPSSSHPAERLGAARAARLRGSTAEEAALLQEAKKKKKKKGNGGGGGGRDTSSDAEEAAPAASALAPTLIFDDDDDAKGDDFEEGFGALLARSHPLLQGVAFASLDDHSAVGALLRSCRPSFLVICDADVSFVRTVELYAASLEHEELGSSGTGSSGTGRGKSGAAPAAAATVATAAAKASGKKARRPFRVYHLRYEHSLESDAYAARLGRERRAFEELISAKAHMSLPDHAAETKALSIAAAVLNDPCSSSALLSLSPPPGTVTAAGRDPSSAANALSVVARPSDATNELTRLGGGGAARAQARAAAAAKLRVVVDVREFMASAALPAALHARGLTLSPCTLEVGDYVLSPALCVERKAIPDLRQSLSSGRLFVQARAMVKHYAVAALLIEFDGDKPFTLNGGVASLENNNAGGGGGGGGGGSGNAAASAASTPFDSGAHSLPARLVILALHVPRLHFLWARSPHAAADLFVALKAGAAREPDPVEAAAVGGEGGGGGGGASVAAQAPRSENVAAVDLLRKLPGVNDSNWRRLADAAGSLAGLAALSEPELARALSGGGGGENAAGESFAAKNGARRLYAFLHAPCPSL